MLLPEFQITWNQQKAAFDSPYGDHLARGERVGGPGDPFGNSPFSFEEHEVADLDLLTLASSGRFEVTDIYPRNQVTANVVLDIASSDKHDPKWMTAATRSLGSVLVEAFQESKPAYEDQVGIYFVGDSKDLRTRNAVHLAKTIDPEDKAKAISRLEGDNLIVISTFSELDPAAIRPRQRGVVKLGVKINHPYQVALPAGIGKWETGDTDQPVVNTKNPDKLDAWNQKLLEIHLARMARGEHAGMAMVHLMCDIRYAKKGFFDPIDGDKVLSRALSRATKLAA